MEFLNQQCCSVLNVIVSTNSQRFRHNYEVHLTTIIKDFKTQLTNEDRYNLARTELLFEYLKDSLPIPKTTNKDPI